MIGNPQTTTWTALRTCLCSAFAAVFRFNTLFGALALRRSQLVVAWFITLAMVSAWLCASLPVFSQEAYYWMYARHIAWSYFDHPPMVAWLIWVGTQLFGDGSFGLRCGTWLCGLIATWVGVVLLRDFGVGLRGQVAWLGVAMVSPVVLMTHFLANPDAPLVAAWTTTMLALWKARRGAARWWLLVGVGCGVALLSKYSGGFLGLGVALLLVGDPMLRPHLRTPWPWAAALVSVAVFSPVLYWNWINDFVSFRFQTTERLESGKLGVGWLGRFLATQAGMLHPLLATGLPATVLFLGRSAIRDPRALHLLGFGVPLVGYLLLQSLWLQVKLNWVAPAYVALLMGMVLWWQTSSGRHQQGRLQRLAMLSLLVVPAATLAAPAIRLVPPGRGSSWTGWSDVASCAKKWCRRMDCADEEANNVFYFAADYRDAAQLGRNLSLAWSRNGCRRCEPTDPLEATLAQNVLGQRSLQFDEWTSATARVGQDAVFVLPRAHERESVLRKTAACFGSVTLAERLNVTRIGVVLMVVDVYLCRQYKGPVAKE